MEYIQDLPNAATSIQVLWGVGLLVSALGLTWMSLKLVSTALKCGALALVVYALLTPATEIQTQVDDVLAQGKTALTQLIEEAPKQESMDFIAQIATELTIGVDNQRHIFLTIQPKNWFKTDEIVSYRMTALNPIHEKPWKSLISVGAKPNLVFFT